MEPSPLGGAMIDAWLERYSDLAAPPLAQCSYARRATANPCNNPSAVRVGLRAPRRSPGPQYMPRSASPVGLARRVLRPQNNSTPDCCFYDPVVLARHGRGRADSLGSAPHGAEDASCRRRTSRTGSLASRSPVTFGALAPASSRASTVAA